jgi:hypothetical protein
MIDRGVAALPLDVRVNDREPAVGPTFVRPKGNVDCHAAGLLYPRDIVHRCAARRRPWG